MNTKELLISIEISFNSPATEDIFFTSPQTL